MSIVSNRVIEHERNSDTTVRLESDLEAGAIAILMAQPGCVAVSAQKHVKICINGVPSDRWFDLCADFDTGCRTLYAVRNEENAAEVRDEVELFRNQDLAKYAHFAFVLTEKEISKPAVYRAREIVRARRVLNEGNNRLVMQSLLNAGGRARVASVLSNIPDVTFARAWDALWSLIDRGHIVHDHPNPHETFLENHSLIRVTESQNP